MRFIGVVIFCNLILFWANAQVKPKKAVFEDVFSDLPIRDPAENSGISPGETPESKIRNNILIIPHLSTTECYPGEPIRVNYELLTTLKSTSEITRFPSLQGFIVKKFMPENEFPVMKTFKGKRYRVFNLLVYHLYPLESGKLLIDSLDIRNTISYIERGNKKSYGGDISSKSLSVIVNPFPEEDKPLSFRGAVGEFNVKIGHKAEILKVNKVDTITFEISGKGNLSNIMPPAITWPEGIEVFESQRLDKIAIGSFPDSGSVAFNFPVLFQRAGLIEIPGIPFSFFNPETQKYNEINGEKLSFQVLPAASIDILPTSVKEQSSGIKWSWWITGLSLIICFYTLSLYWKERKKRIKAELKIAEFKVEPAALPELKEVEVESKTKFLDAIDGLRQIEHPLLYIQALKELLKSFLAEEASSNQHSEEELVKLFITKDDEYGKKVHQLVEECNQYIYSGVPIPQGYQIRMENILREIINHQTAFGNE